MCEIFENARKVQIWLDNSDNDMKSAFETIRGLGQFMGEYKSQGRIWESLVTFRVQLWHHSQSMSTRISTFRKVTYVVMVLAHLTLQEVVVGPLTKSAELAQICERWRQAGMIPL